jgi:dGTP triphosphohydrolase
MEDYSIEENSTDSRDNGKLVGKKEKKSKKSKNKSKTRQNQNFENYIMDAYKKISFSNEDEEDNDEESKTILYDSQMKVRIKYCEKKITCCPENFGN